MPKSIRQSDTRIAGGHSQMEEELNSKFHNRPHNHSPTLPFHDLFLTLFNPLLESKKKPTGPVNARRKVGPHGGLNPNSKEARKNIIRNFINRWRQEVGDDIHPALRLVMPDKDRERPMYGLKEKVIGKLLVKVMRLDANSEDGNLMLNWKLPGNTKASRMVGDFAGRCYGVLSKRPMRVNVGDMSIEEVNAKLDELSLASKEEDQLPIFEEFYRRMNPEEFMWLIRIILRQMRIGATEKTIFSIWHPQAEGYYNVTSSLQKVCWDLNPEIKLENTEVGVTLMECFQPQLAQYSEKGDFEAMVGKMRPTDEDPYFWIEEKLDGERMQLHMQTDHTVPGGKKFQFWSRRAKDYTYLYGEGFEDKKSALTQHIKDGFDDGVDSIILDGEMITWDPERDKMEPFGSLKTAALSLREDPYSTGIRPLFRVFDILYLNRKSLTGYTLRDRRRALEASVNSIYRRMEILEYTEATKSAEIEPLLRKVIEERSEGLVLKNPRAMYKLNERNDDWMKVKPEYLTEYGESLDCIVIGGYYGSGHRGGALASFLCGLRVDKAHVDKGANPMKCYSFFKVGGGFTAADYANIRHHTDGKWKDWDPKRPPLEFIELGGHERNLQHERPDVWIRPDDSVVLEVKAASVNPTDQFRMGVTIRFPRFKKLRGDKNWETALSIQEFNKLQDSVEKQRKEKALEIDQSRKKRPRRSDKKPLTIAGYDEVFVASYEGPPTEVFKGLSFYVMTESLSPEKRSKPELEQMIKANGGQIFQSEHAEEGIICIGERRTVKVVSLQKRNTQNIIRPKWLFDCVAQCRADAGLPDYLLPLEPQHVYFLSDSHPLEALDSRIDRFGDSYTRSTGIAELKDILGTMRLKPRERKAFRDLKERLFDRDQNTEPLAGWMFEGLRFYFDELKQVDVSGHTESSENSLIVPHLRSFIAQVTARFGGGSVSSDIDDLSITHVVVGASSNVRVILDILKLRRQMPRIVTTEFIEESWKEKTLLAEERFAPT